MNRRSLGAALAAALLLGGCAGSAAPTSDEVAAGADRDAPGAADVAGGAKGKKENGSSAGSASSTRTSGGSNKSTGSGGAKTSTSIPGPSGAKILPPSVVIDDAGDQFAVDTETGAPAEDGVGGPVYSDIVRASIQDRGAAWQFTLRFAGPLPDGVGDEENLFAGIGLTGSDGRTFTVLLQGTRDGWTTGYQTKDESGDVDEWRIDGAQVVWTVRKELVDVGDEFEWGASLRLLYLQSAGVPRGDKAPESGPMQYPE